MRKQLAIVQKVVPPFRAPVFRAMAEELDMVVCHSRKKSSRTKPLASELDFQNLYLKSWYYRDSDTALVQDLRPLLFRVRPRVVVCDFALGFASFWILFLTRRLFGFKLAVWTHGIRGNEMDRPFRSKRAMFQLFLLNRLDGVVSYSEKRSEILRQYVRNPEKIFLAKNTLDTVSLQREFERLELSGRKNVAKEVGFTHRFNLVFLGRILPEKDVAGLLSAFAKVHGNHDVCLHIVGPGPIAELEAKASAEGIPVRFHGAVYDQEQVGKILYASDLLVMPNAVGLAIVHAFCFGLPILTTEMDSAAEPAIIHGPEIEYLKPGINGMLCKKEGLAIAIDELLSNPSDLLHMREAALHTAREECNVGQLLDGFKAITAYLGGGKLMPPGN